MADYPDYTRAEQIIGTDIMVPIDIQGAYIMMPVDIQAQYVTLSIDIVAQTVGDINVNLAAQSLGNVAVNLAAQSVANLSVNINTQTVAVYTGAEWNILQGNDKSLFVSAGNMAAQNGTYVSYTITSGKTLFINSMSFSSSAYAAANGDLNQIGYVYLLNFTDTINLSMLGGNGGNSISFPSPYKIAAGKTIHLLIFNASNHAVNMYASMTGFEV